MVLRPVILIATGIGTQARTQQGTAGVSPERVH